jgi:hypothetical protein
MSVCAAAAHSYRSLVRGSTVIHGSLADAAACTTAVSAFHNRQTLPPARYRHAPGPFPSQVIERAIAFAHKSPPQRCAERAFDHGLVDWDERAANPFEY